MISKHIGRSQTDMIRNTEIITYPFCNLPFFSTLIRSATFHSSLLLSVLQPSILLYSYPSCNLPFFSTLIRPATFHFSLNSSYPSCNLPFFSTLIRHATFHSSLNSSYPSCNLPFFSELFLSVLQPSILL